MREKLVAGKDFDPYAGITTGYICAKGRGFQGGFVKVDGQIVPNRTITQVTPGKVFTTTETIEGDVEVVLFNGEVEIPTDVYAQMYP